MTTESKSKKVRLLEALASGRSCEQILADDHSLSYHDIFHAVAEPPTSFWRRKLARLDKPSSPETQTIIPAFAKYRID